MLQINPQNYGDHAVYNVRTASPTLISVKSKVYITSFLIKAQTILSWLRAYKYVVSVNRIGAFDKNYFIDHLVSLQLKLALFAKTIAAELEGSFATDSASIEDSFRLADKFCTEGIMALAQVNVKVLVAAVDNCGHALNDLVLALNVIAHKQESY